MSGPDKVETPGSFSCCLQQGIMMISNYTFIYKGAPIYNVLPDFTWANGYTMQNILNANNCLSKVWDEHFDCSTIYEGQRTYTRVDNYDPTKFPSPGETIGVTVSVYAHCFYHRETICLKTCVFSSGISYRPPTK